MDALPANAQNCIQQGCKIRLSGCADVRLKVGVASATDPNARAPGIFRCLHVRFMISDEEGLPGIDVGESASGKYHGRGGFAALAFFVRTVRTIKGGLNTPAIFLDLAE